MKLNPKPATRKGQTMRTAIFGASGSGKTICALEIAKELVGGDMTKVLVVDTEYESSGLYAHEYPFMIQAWDGEYDPISLAELISQADQSNNFEVIIVDGLTPFWSGKGGMLDLVERYAPKGNSQAGWGKATNHENELKEQILATRTHFIATMRAKPLSGEDPDPSLNSVGMKPDQRHNVLYEFNTVLYIHKDHRSQIIKSRCSLLDENKIFPAKGGVQQYAQTEKEWLADNTKYIDANQTEKLKALFNQIPVDLDKRKTAKERFVSEYGSPDRLAADQFDSAFKFTQDLMAEFTAADPFLEDDETVIIYDGGPSEYGKKVE